MKKEDLIALKKELNSLTEEELVERNLYLRGLANGDIQGPPVGYPSIDKPWLKYYEEEHIMSDVPHMTCYEMLCNNISSKEDSIAIEYMGRKITYREVIQNIEKTAKAFQKLGVKKGDIVSFLMVNTPEMVYSFYALNLLGAIPNMIDPRSNEQGLNNYLNEVQSKILVTLDACCPNLESVIDNTCTEKVVLLPAVNSAAFPVKTVFYAASALKKKDKLNNDFLINWNKFIKNGESEFVSAVKYEEDYPAAMVHTGGTTGIPKAVLLSNDNFNAVVSQVVNSPIPMEEKDKFLNILVPFVAYGLALGMHVPMSLGWDSVLIPKFSPEEIVNLMCKHKPAGVMGIATYYEPLLNSNKYDFSSSKVILMGGMPTKSEFEKQMNEKIANSNGNFSISKGYSMTEASSCATCSFSNVNELGSNGVPLVKTVIAAFDPTTGEELQNGELGEICIFSPTMMLEYYNNVEETNNVLRTHEDGKIWIHSGDIGYVSNDGFVYIVDRIKRMIIRNGFKVFPSEIENVFLKHPSVESCAVIGIDDEMDDKAPKAYITLKSDNVESMDKIVEQLKKYVVDYGLPSYFLPVDFEFREKLPLTNIGKIDYKQLEIEEKKDYVKKKTLK